MALAGGRDLLAAEAGRLGLLGHFISFLLLLLFNSLWYARVMLQRCAALECCLCCEPRCSVATSLRGVAISNEEHLVKKSLAHGFFKVRVCRETLPLFY
jgi:hypothetical protein